MKNFLAALALAALCSPALAGSLEGRPAPDFSLATSGRQEIRLGSLKGKVVLVNFWASWCEPCKEEMPSLERLARKMKGKPFAVLAITGEAAGDPALGAFLAKEKYSFPILHDPGEKVAKKLFRTTGVPETFIIAPDGRIARHVLGPMEWDAAPVVRYFEDLAKQAK